MKLVLGGAIVAWVVGASLLAPWLSSHGVDAMDMENRLSPPSAEHWLGTDNFGRDLWTRIAHGGRISLVIGLVSVGAASLLGTMLGLLAGFFGGALEAVVMRVVDLFLSFPPFVLVLALVAAMGPGVGPVTVALIAVFWTEYARVARAVALAESGRDYVTAARALGASEARLLLRHVLPRALGPMLVLASLGIGTAIVAESGLSFLGLGVEPPAPSWGWTLAYGMRYLRSDLWFSTVPGCAILVTVLGFHLLGDGLRERLEPQRQQGIARRGLLS